MDAKRWDERYAGPGYAYGLEPNDFLVSVAGHLPPGPMLSLAEGEGRNALFLAGRGHDVLAVDQSTVGLAKARERARELGVPLQTRQADLGEFVIEPGAWAANWNLSLGPTPCEALTRSGNILTRRFTQNN